jgi:predicted transcriptional regulator|tara:strand:+ start:168 stop:830 length:663 start_codon:yes stop_codon:yes gene_type:complete
MKAIELIQNDIPPVRINETIEKALNWMDEFKLNHIPVVNETEYVGLLSDDMVYDYNQLKDPISNINFIGKQQSVLENAHFFQVMSLISSYKLSVVPVCDEQRNYKGSISTKKLINVFSKQSGFNSSGAVITLLVNDFDYQLSQIAQIIESNDAKILSLYSENLESNNQLKLTIKISDGKLGAVLQTFSRYDYTVQDVFSDDEINNQSKQRYDHLMKYLNV